MKAVGETYMAIAAKMLEVARENFAAQGFLTPVAFVGKLNGALVIFDLDTRNEDAKLRSLAIVRSTARMMSADFVLTIIESWVVTLPCTSRAEADKIAERVAGTLAKHPDRKECVHLTLHTLNGKLLGVCAVQRTPTPTIGEPQWNEDFTGHFSDLLPHGADNGLTN